MKKKLVLIAFTTLVSVGSFAQDSSGAVKPNTSMHKKRMHTKSMTDSTSTMSSMSSDSSNMGQMPMDKKSMKKTSTTTTVDSTK